MNRWLVFSACLCALILPSVSPATVLIDDDFEAGVVGTFPAGWMDIGQAPGAFGNAVNPSTVIGTVNDAFGNPTKAAQIVADFANSQGIYKPFADIPIVGTSMDVRVDRFATVSGGLERDWAWFVGLQDLGTSDPSVATSIGSFVSSFDRQTGSFVLSTPVTETFTSGVLLDASVWYNVNTQINQTAGTVKVLITRIHDGVVVADFLHTITNWPGFGGAPNFDSFSILDGELDALATSNITWIDNVRVEDQGIPPPPPPAVCGNGVVEAGEDCDLPTGACCNNTTCTFLSGNVCRNGSADGFCDPAETCPGNSADCPGNFVRPNSTVCRAGSGDVCDPTESCPGTAGSSCPANSIQGAGTICNAGSGDICDPAEVCSGVTGQPCPAGSTNLAAAGTVCNVGSGDVCDPDEVCSGTEGAACPANVVLPSTEVCGPSSDECDLEETCPGVPGGGCPADTLAPAGTACGAPPDGCEVPATCDGLSATCPPSQPLPPTDGCTVDGVANQPCLANDSGQVVVGTGGDDVIIGGLGDDTLRGLVGNDVLCGLEGVDTLVGGSGEDSLFGGPGEDTLRGDQGDDFLAGGPGNDTLVGGGANDILEGEDGDDVLRGEAGDDSLSGGNDHDLLRGGGGVDTLLGDAGDDTLFGEDQNDFLTGGDDVDSLNGGGGQDTCDGETESKCEL